MAKSFVAMKGFRSSWAKLFFAILLLVGLPVFIWAVATQRIELRKKAAETQAICWSSAINADEAIARGDTPGWSDSCAKMPSGSNCASLAVPVQFTPAEVTGYKEWVLAGKPYIPGCNTVSPISCNLTTNPPALCPSGYTCQSQSSLEGAPGVCLPNPPTPYVGPGCARMGCNGELCRAQNDAQGANSICMVRPEYVCYQTGRCEKQSNGVCNWTQSAELLACLSGFTNPTPSPTSCSPDGSACTSTANCPVCTTGQCPKYACLGQPGVCQNNICVPNPTPTPTVTPTPTPSPSPSPTPPPGCYVLQTYPPQTVCPSVTPIPSCTRSTPVVTINPPNQSGSPGQTLTYTATITNKDVGCSSEFSFTATGSMGLTTTTSLSGIVLPAGGTIPVTFTAKSVAPFTSTRTIPVMFFVVNKSSGMRSSATATYTLVNPLTQKLEIWVRLAGVTGGQANGAKLTSVKFYLRNGGVMAISTPLNLTFQSGTSSGGGTGVYSATVTITNPISAGTQFRLSVKGEKHGAVKFCNPSLQTGPCGDNEYITMPATSGTYRVYLTGIPLPAGDLNQDGTINQTDVNLITNIFKKPSSQITAADLRLADVNYDGFVDNFDLSLVLQSLATRYDE